MYSECKLLQIKCTHRAIYLSVKNGSMVIMRVILFIYVHKIIILCHKIKFNAYEIFSWKLFVFVCFFFYWYTLFEDRDDRKSRFSIAEFKCDIIKLAAYSDHYRSKPNCFVSQQTSLSHFITFSDKQDIIGTDCNLDLHGD